MEIIPTINTDNKEKVLEEIAIYNDVILPHGYELSRVQIDINDGTYENVLTVTPEIFKDLFIKPKLDYHLMVANPMEWIGMCLHGQADRVIAHIENLRSQSEFCEMVKNSGLKAGLAVGIDTSLEAIDPSVFDELSVILLMAYPAGRGGKTLQETVYGKIEKLYDMREKNMQFFKICLDGGVTEDNIKRIKTTGADEAAIGSRILDGDVEINLEKYYKLMY